MSNAEVASFPYKEDPALEVILGKVHDFIFDEGTLDKKDTKDMLKHSEFFRGLIEDTLQQGILVGYLSTETKLQILVEDLRIHEDLRKKGLAKELARVAVLKSTHLTKTSQPKQVVRQPISNPLPLLVREEAQNTEWKEKGACRGLDPDLFHPERGENTDIPKEVCKECEVRAECREYAIVNLEKNGIWGGLSERERRRIRSQRAQAARKKIA